MPSEEPKRAPTPPPGTAAKGELRSVAVAWEALEDAFENNAPEVHSYLHLETGEVVRIVDGIADPGMHKRVMGDATYLRVDPVSSREQYRWMERFIATVEEGELRDKLVQSIDGKGAFRRFKDVLMSFPIDRERWFTFRGERLRACMEAWLEAHEIKAVPRTEWHVPTAEEIQKTMPEVATTEPTERPKKTTRGALADSLRKRIHELTDVLPARELDAALAFLEFLRDRKHLPRARAKGDEGEGEALGSEASEPASPAAVPAARASASDAAPVKA